MSRQDSLSIFDTAEAKYANGGAIFVNGNGTMNGNNSTGYAKIRLIGMIKE